MKSFEYRALDPQGTVQNGHLEAVDRHQAMLRLGELGMRVLSLQGRLEVVKKKGAPAVSEETRGRPAREAVVPGEKVRLTTRQITDFTDDLADLVESELRIDHALQIIANRDSKSPVARVAAELRRLVREGVRFSTALEQVSPSFSQLYRNLVHAGEASAALPIVLKRQSEFLRNMDELKQKVVGALIYPAVIFVAVVIVVSLFLTQLAPQMVDFLSSAQVSLPWTTQVLMGISDAVGKYWWLGLLVLAGLGSAFWAWLQQPRGRLIFSRWVYQAPAVGPVIRAEIESRFCRTLSTLLEGGVPLLKALGLLREGLGNEYVNRGVAAAEAQVSEGASLGGALRSTGVFASDFVDVLGVGEQTGDLPRSLGKLGDRCERRLARTIERLTALITPVMILIVAGVVLFIAYSMMSAIFELMSRVRTAG